MKSRAQEALEKLYTPKQMDILADVLNKDWYMLILHGAVRAGKTVLNNDLFLQELLRAKANGLKEDVDEPMYILAAASSGTLHTNVLHELSNKYGIEFKFDRYNNFKLFGVRVITTFTSTIAGLKSIRGMTSYGAYVNEASLANQEVFDEIKKRCSGYGARILSDTNPDHPQHWLKVDYIDKADGDTIIEYNFTLFDNTFINKRYIDNLIASTPSGTMTERGIHGRWTIGKGAIYRDFNKDKHVITPEEVPKDNIRQYIVGVDWGYEHYGAMVVIGIDDKGKHYVVEEHAHQHLHMRDWVDIAKGIAERYGEFIPFYCDSARPEYVDELYNSGFNAMNGMKSILPGITEVGSLIKLGKLVVVDTLKRFLTEVNQYVWSKTGDAPISKMDDVLDAVRYAIYTNVMMNKNQYG